MAEILDKLIQRARSGDAPAVSLVEGDRALAEPAAERLARALAEAAGCELEVHRRPSRLSPILADLRTFALFASAKVVLVVETGALADRSAAAAFVDEAADAVPLSPEGDLSPSERQAAVRLLQAVRLFDLDPLEGEPEALLGRLPDWVFQGARKGGRKRSKKTVTTLREDLAGLLAAAREAGLHGFGEEEVSELAAAVRDGLPEGHSLVLAESSVAADHPVVSVLGERGAVVRLARVEEQRSGWAGLDELAGELARQTGITITSGGLGELARRTLRKEGSRRGQEGAESTTTDRFAAEYRKLAELAEGAGRDAIDREMVAEAVEDRGQEDVFKILDAVGEGRGREAMERLGRHLGSSSDPNSARLAFFALFAGFCRNLTAVAGMARATGVRRGERHYGRFKSNLAPKLQGDLEGRKSPLAGLHPYRLHRAYLAASRIDAGYLSTLPARVLETELALKGESGEGGAALAELLAEVAGRVR